MTLVSRPPLKARQTFPFDMVDMCDVAIDGKENQEQEKEQLERDGNLWGGEVRYLKQWIESFPSLQSLTTGKKKFWRETSLCPWRSGALPFWD